MTIPPPELDAGAQPKILTRRLDFFYGSLHALKSVTVPLYANNLTAFIGPCGCGKSTLQRRCARPVFGTRCRVSFMRMAGVSRVASSNGYASLAPLLPSGG